MKIHAEVPGMLNSSATPLNTAVYANWDKFLEAFLSKGTMFCYSKKKGNNCIQSHY